MTFEELIVKQALEIESLKVQVDDFTQRLEETMAIPATFLRNNPNTMYTFSDCAVPKP